MSEKPLLIIDDEVNIRLTLSRTLEDMGLTTEGAVNGEEALEKLKEKDFDLVFLDLRLPGIDGLEVLRQAKALRPDLRVIVITAYASVEAAVEAMKLGAVDFIQKPFTPGEIRDLVYRIKERELLKEQVAKDYDSLIELAKSLINERSYDIAEHYVKLAMAESPSRPEAYNLHGALLEIRGLRLEAIKFYRAALDIDPTYKPAQGNLERVTSWRPIGKITLEDRYLD